ncbi:MAG: galactose mutarotase [Clostridiales bacterium]|nr:galactose mutarotase [Clostridiales bacterium]
MQRQLYDRIDGKDIYIYTIAHDNIEVDICEMGARINAIRVNGVDIVLGYNSVRDYLVGGGYIGATIGRVANRIAAGKFSLGAKKYSLNTNDGKNHLHGGIDGFDKKLFTVLSAEKCCIVLQYISDDGEEGYPGRLTFTAKFGVVDKTLNIDFAAESDKDTLWCPTNHAYFNLNGEQNGDCRDNLLQINADYYTPVDGGLIPTGEKKAVKNTPFDFNGIKQIGADFDSIELASTFGYDHNYLLNGDHAAHVESEVTGIKMDVYTDMPCLQLYTGGQLCGAKGKNGKYNKWAAFCLEPQYCPNAINMRGFAKPILKKGENKIHYIRYKFD